MKKTKIKITLVDQKGDETIPARLELLNSQMEALIKQKEQIEETMSRLSYKIERYEEAIKTGKLGRVLAWSNQIPDTTATGADIFEVLPAYDHYPMTYAELTDIVKQEQQEIVPQFIQVEAHPYFTQRELRQILKQYDIKLMSWYPLGHGDKALIEEPVFTELGKKYGKTSAQIIRWSIWIKSII